MNPVQQTDEFCVLMPVYSHVNFRLQNLLHEMSIPVLANTGMSDIAMSRSLIISKALRETKVKRFLWLDADMVMKKEDMITMLTHPEPLVSGVYVNSEGNVCCRSEVNMPLPESGLIDIKWAGFGCVSMAREVAEAVVEGMPLLPVYNGVWPAFFPILVDADGNEVGVDNPKAVFWKTEDLSFFWRAKKKGYQAKLQCDVRLGHLKEVPLPVGMKPQVLDARGF